MRKKKRGGEKEGKKRRERKERGRSKERTERSYCVMTLMTHCLRCVALYKSAAIRIEAAVLFVTLCNSSDSHFVLRPRRSYCEE